MYYFSEVQQHITRNRSLARRNIEQVGNLSLKFEACLEKHFPFEGIRKRFCSCHAHFLQMRKKKGIKFSFKKIERKILYEETILIVYILLHFAIFFRIKIFQFKQAWQFQKFFYFLVFISQYSFHSSNKNIFST